MKEFWISGALALMIAAPPQVNDQAVQQTTGQQQQIPDAPKPQTTGLGPVAPGKGTTIISNGSQTPPPTNDPDAPGTSLPASPSSAVGPADPEAGAAPDQPDASQGPTYLLRTRSTFVDVPFTVKDKKGKLVPGLEWRDVRVYENGLRQHISVFTVDPFPLSVALVIDQSLSVDTMTRVNNSLGALQGAFTPYDEVAVFTYNHGVKKQTDFTAGQSARLAAVVERSKAVGSENMYYAPGEGLERGIDINNGAQANMTPLGQGPGRQGGMTPQVPRETHTLNDAILEAAKATTRAGKDRRRVVYVISDGKEYGSIAKTKEVLKYLATNNITVFATLVGDSAVEGLGFLDSVHLPLTMRDNILPVYTAATGGETYAEYRTRGIETSFQRIAEEVRTQYTIGYYPSSHESALDEKFRTIEVKITRPNLSIIAKKGYYPSASAVPPPPAVQPRPNPVP